MMPDLLQYINSLAWRFVHFLSGPVVWARRIDAAGAAGMAGNYSRNTFNIR
jgi:hypothetical protein